MAKLITQLLALLILFIPSLSCPHHQKQALLHFKASILNATAYSSNKDMLLFSFKSWNTTSDCCNWERVHCSSRFDSRTVIALYLDNLVELLVLTSTIFTPLFHIRSLTHLDISLNGIEGELPGNGWANLSKLVHLDLRWNNFNGSIPSQLFHLRYLQYLDIRGNSFQGELLGNCLANLSKLVHPDLWWNNFNGSIPSQLFHLRNLHYLDMAGISF
jgi:hypothetical protein